MNPKGFVLLCCIVYLLDLIIGGFKGLKGNGINNTPLVVLPITPTTGEGAMVRMRGSLDGLGLQPEIQSFCFLPTHQPTWGSSQTWSRPSQDSTDSWSGEVRHIPSFSLFD